MGLGTGVSGDGRLVSMLWSWPVSRSMSGSPLLQWRSAYSELYMELDN